MNALDILGHLVLGALVAGAAHAAGLWAPAAVGLAFAVGLARELAQMKRAADPSFGTRRARETLEVTAGGLAAVLVLVAIPATAQPVTLFPTNKLGWRYVSDCTAETAGVQGEVCVDSDQPGIFVCTTATCEGAGWVHAFPGSGTLGAPLISDGADSGSWPGGVVIDPVTDRVTIDPNGTQPVATSLFVAKDDFNEICTGFQTPISCCTDVDVGTCKTAGPIFAGDNETQSPALCMTRTTGEDGDQLACFGDGLQFLNNTSLTLDGEGRWIFSEIGTSGILRPFNSVPFGQRRPPGMIVIRPDVRTALSLDTTAEVGASGIWHENATEDLFLATLKSNRLLFCDPTDLSSPGTIEYTTSGTSLTADSGTPFATFAPGDWIALRQRTGFGAAPPSTNNAGIYEIATVPSSTSLTTVETFATNEAGSLMKIWRCTESLEPVAGGGLATGANTSLDVSGGKEGAELLVASGTATPATCEVGALFVDTDDGALCTCRATNTWSCGQHHGMQQWYFTTVGTTKFASGLGLLHSSLIPTLSSISDNSYRGHVQAVIGRAPATIERLCCDSNQHTGWTGSDQVDLCVFEWGPGTTAANVNAGTEDLSPCLEIGVGRANDPTTWTNLQSQVFCVDVNATLSAALTTIGLVARNVTDAGTDALVNGQCTVTFHD